MNSISCIFLFQWKALAAEMSGINLTCLKRLKCLKPHSNILYFGQGFVWMYPGIYMNIHNWTQIFSNTCITQAQVTQVTMLQMHTLYCRCCRSVWVSGQDKVTNRKHCTQHKTCPEPTARPAESHSTLLNRQWHSKASYHVCVQKPTQTALETWCS